MSSTAKPVTREQVTPGWYAADPYTTDLKTNPHSVFRQLREQAPVNLTPDGSWRLSRYADIQKLLKHSAVGVRTLDGLIPDHSREQSDSTKFMLRMDPPDHGRLRKLVSKAFTPAALSKIRPQVQQMLDTELDRVIPSRKIDLVEHLALPVPAASMCAMLGVPFEDRNRLSGLVSLATYMLAIQSFPKLEAKAMAALEELAGYMMELIEQRRQSPGEDILSALVQAEEDGDKLSVDELLQQSIGILIAGLETTIGLICNGMRCFAQHPEQFELLASQPDLVGTAVEECLRFDPSVPYTRRVLWEATEFSGVEIPADSVITAILIGANRDPEVFADPDRFDITRNEARHCSFGGGIHFCLGSHLARMNAEIAFSAMASRVTNLELHDEQFEWAPSLFRIPGRSPVSFQLRRC